MAFFGDCSLDELPDRGFFSSAEVRVPVLFDKRRNPLVQLAPFFDIGGDWNVGSFSATTGTVAVDGTVTLTHTAAVSLKVNSMF